MITDLLKTAESLQKRWDLESFPKQAHKALGEITISQSLAEFESEISAWLLSTKKVPDQLNLFNVFGEPSITLFNNQNFAVDIYFWWNNDTIIHSHGFRGAFKVLYGESLHEKFTVEVVKEIAPDVHMTEVNKTESKSLSAGDTEMILPGKELVHRVIHQGKPTVSLCIRTVDDKSLSQWNHLEDGLSYQKRSLSDEVIKRLLYFQYLLQTDSEKAQSFLVKVLNEMELSEQIALYESLHFAEVGLGPASSELVIDLLAMRFEGQQWFELHQQHFESVATT